jgi:predicted RNA-binding protein Jag
MSEAAAAAVVATVPQDKRPQVETLLADVFRLMDYPAKLEFKDMPDGSLGVAVHFEGELPGITSGKRSYLVDSVQFWLNKVVNRPNVPRRWVNLGVDSFPEPRMPGQPREPREPREPPQQPSPSAPAAAAPPREKRAEQPPKKPEQNHRDRDPKKQEPRASTPPPQQQQRRNQQADERSLTPAADPLLTTAGQLLAEKSAKHGRLYGVMLLTPDARALMLKAADGVKGVTAKVEGEGHWRRLVLVPEKLTVIVKKQVMPDYDDEDEDE